MNWGSPASFAWVSLTVLVLAFYLLRPRRQRIVFSSLLVWRRTISRRETDGWAAWLRRRVLLILQLMAVVLVALALARPEQQGTVELGPPAALVVDTSASMAIQANGGSRMDKVRAQAKKLVGSLEDAARVTVIAAGPIPRLLVANETNRATVDRSLDELASEVSDGQVEVALDIARSIADPARGGQIYLFTDRIPSGRNAAYDGVRIVAVGAPISNVAVEVLEIRRRLDAPDVVEALVTVRNDGSEPVDVSLMVSPGSQSPIVRSVRLGPQTKTSVVFDQLPIADGYRVSAVSQNDVFGADNDAFGTLNDYFSIKVIVVGDDPDPIVRALQSFTGVNVVASEVDAFRSDPGVADLYVFQHFVPTDFPTASIVLVQPPDIRALSLERQDGRGLLAIPRPKSPIMQAIDARDVQSDKNWAYTAPDWASIDVGDARRAVVGHGILDGRRTVFIGLDLVSTGVSQAFWYPMFWANVLRWADPFRPLQRGTELVSANPVRLVTHPRADRVVVVAPDGSKTQFTDGRLTTLYVTVPGPYRVHQFSKEVLIGESIIDFSPSMRSSDSRSSTVLPSTGSVGTSKTFARQILELFPWFVGAAFVALVSEWWLFNRIRGVR